MTLLKLLQFKHGPVYLCILLLLLVIEENKIPQRTSVIGKRVLTCRGIYSVVHTGLSYQRVQDVFQ